jgi:type IV pilus biogenesis protein PilP
MSARNVRLLVIVALGMIAAAALLRTPPPPPAPLPEARARAPRPVRSGAVPPVAITRNIFEYAPRPTPAATARPMAAPTFEPVPITAPTEPPVRLVGLVRRGATTKAVLQMRGRTVEVAVGETAGGYRVLAVDDDGVRLQAEDGTVVALAAGAP